MEELPIPEGYTILERIAGHIIKRAPGAGKEANWGYKAKNENCSECALLYCKPGVYTIVDLDMLEILGKHTWCIMKSGYPGAKITMNNKQVMITMHAFLMMNYKYSLYYYNNIVFLPNDHNYNLLS